MLSRTASNRYEPLSVILIRLLPFTDFSPAFRKPGEIFVTEIQECAMSAISDAAGIRVVWLPLNLPPDLEYLLDIIDGCLH